MKLKYYLRGLAVGVILTTIIITIANADNRPMTDAEVRKRALELGMVESSSLKLTDVGESTQQSSSEQESKETVVESESISESKETVVESESSSESKETSVEAESSVETSQESSEPESAVEGAFGGETVLITIKSGDSSYTVSKALAAAGLVEDAVEYDTYLCNNGYSRRIRTGTYEITLGMSYEEIAKIIAG